MTSNAKRTIIRVLNIVHLLFYNILTSSIGKGIDEIVQSRRYGNQGVSKPNDQKTDHGDNRILSSNTYIERDIVLGIRDKEGENDRNYDRQTYYLLS